MNERDRIEYLMNLYGLTPSQFSDRTGIQRASVSHILSNRNKPSLEILLKIYHAFEDVELAWLVAGEGNPPTITQEDDENQNIIESMSGEDISKQPNMLFSFAEDEAPGSSNEGASVDATATVKVAEAVQALPVDDATEDKMETVVNSAKSEGVSRSLSMVADSSKRIREIKIFYDNGTYETFLPEKA